MKHPADTKRMKPASRERARSRHRVPASSVTPSLEALEPCQLLTAIVNGMTPRLVATAGATAYFNRASLAADTPGATPLKRDRPATSRVPIRMPPGQLAPPALSGTSKTVDLTIGSNTGKSAQPLGVNIGSLTSYAQGNSVNELIPQAGGFELATGRIMVHVTGTDSTDNQIVIEGAWNWGVLGYSPAIGQMLVGSTGANMDKSWRIADMQDQLDASGNPNGNVIITIDGAFDSVPLPADSFYVDLKGYALPQLSDNTIITGNATVTRDLSTAHGGGASALITLGDASTSPNSVSLGYYLGADATAGRNVLQQGHTYQFSFWAKSSSAASAQLSIYQGKNGGQTTVSLNPDGDWHQYTFTLTANNPVAYDNGAASILISGDDESVNVDDIHLTDLSDQIAPGNPLSSEVVSLVQQYGFSNLRFWNPDLRFASLDDIIGNPEDRPMIIETYGNYNPQLGLPEMLEMAKETGTTAWLVIPTTWSAAEIHNLMEYLGGDASTPYGAKRVADGHPGSWFDDLKGIYFEAGNESWNGTFSPNSYNPFEPYFTRAEDMFHAFKTDPLYAANAAKMQLVVNGWQWVPWYTQTAVASVPDADAVDVSAYTTGPNTDMPLDTLLGGVMSMQGADDAINYPSTIFGKKVFVYEEAAGELQGELSAATESDVTTSLGAGLSVIHNAMTLERDYGMGIQNLFTMFQRGNNLPAGYSLGHYGIFSDLTTATTNPRPIALAAQLLNRAQGEILSSSVSPGWTVDSTSTIIAAQTTQAADAMVTFDGQNLVITLFNDTVADDQNTVFHFTAPSMIDGKPVNFDWANASFKLLTGPSVAANNETSPQVTITSGNYTRKNDEIYAALPGHSMGSLVIPVLPTP